MQERWIPRHPAGLSRRLGSKIDQPFVQKSINFWTKRRSVFHAQFHGISSQKMIDVFVKKSIGFWSENDKSLVPKVIKKLIIICSILNRSFYELCRHAGCHLRSVRGPSFSQGRQGMSQVWLGQSNAPTRVFTGSRFGALSYCSFLLCVIP